MCDYVISITHSTQLNSIEMKSRRFKKSKSSARKFNGSKKGVECIAGQPKHYSQMCSKEKTRLKLQTRSNRWQMQLQKVQRVCHDRHR